MLRWLSIATRPRLFVRVRITFNNIVVLNPDVVFFIDTGFPLTIFETRRLFRFCFGKRQGLRPSGACVDRLLAEHCEPLGVFHVLYFGAGDQIEEQALFSGEDQHFELLKFLNYFNYLEKVILRVEVFLCNLNRRGDARFFHETREERFGHQTAEADHIQLILQHFEPCFVIPRALFRFADGLVQFVLEYISESIFSLLVVDVFVFVISGLYR